MNKRRAEILRLLAMRVTEERAQGASSLSCVFCNAPVVKVGPSPPLLPSSVWVHDDGAVWRDGHAALGLETEE